MVRDLSALSLRRLREMFKAMTFNWNGDAVAEKVVIKNQVEKKSEVQVAVDEYEKKERRLEELRKEKQEKMPDETEKKLGAKMQEEKIEGKIEWQPVMSFEAKRSDSSPKEVETEKKVEAELVEAEKQLKLPHFSVEEKFWYVLISTLSVMERSLSSLQISMLHDGSLRNKNFTSPNLRILVLLCVQGLFDWRTRLENAQVLMIWSTMKPYV